MRGKKLTETSEEKDVGVQVTNNLKPSKHCNRAATRALAVLKQITKNFHFRDRFTFLRLYTQYVRPHVEFAAPAWSPWMEGDKQQIERVQEKAVKMVTGLKGKTYEERCAELGIETLERRRERQDMVEVHRLLSGKIMTDTESILPRASRRNAGTSDGTTTRRGADPLTLSKQYSRTDARKHSFALRVVDSWNKLTLETRSASGQKKFKMMLKKEWPIPKRTGQDN
jgi:hypothetical protein